MRYVMISFVITLLLTTAAYLCLGFEATLIILLSAIFTELLIK